MKTMKKNQVEILGQKKIFEMKISVGGINSVLISRTCSKFEDRSGEAIPPKKEKNSEQRFRDLSNLVMWLDMCVNEVSEGDKD